MPKTEYFLMVKLRRLFKNLIRVLFVGTPFISMSTIQGWYDVTKKQVFSSLISNYHIEFHSYYMISNEFKIRSTFSLWSIFMFEQNGEKVRKIGDCSRYVVFERLRKFSSRIFGSFSFILVQLKDMKYKLLLISEVSTWLTLKMEEYVNYT